MLMTAARALDDHDTEEMAERGYRDTAGLIMEIDRVLPGLVIREMEQDGLPVRDVSAWASSIVHEAWTHKQLSSSAA
jgi:hypothetical protein